MKLIKLILHKYSRMARSREHLEYSPSLPIQLIIGSNGAGKSSMLFEMFPLASNKDDFHEGGYKDATYEHEGKLYRAHSYFRTPTAKEMVHELLEMNSEGEWVNLNDGPTAKGHNENVQKIFNITPRIRELLLSITNFSKMDPGKRRELFQQMSDVDFTFGLSLYQRTQKELKANAAIMKYLGESLLSEMSNVISEDQVKQIEATVKELHDELQKLYQIKTPYKPEYRDLTDRVRSNLVETQRIVSRVLDIELAYPTQVTNPHPDIIRPLVRSKEDELIWTRSRIDVVHKTYYQLKNQVGDLNIAQGNYIVETQERAEKLKKEIEALRQGLSFPKAFADHEIEEGVRSFRAAYPQLMEIFSKQPENQERFYSNANLKDLNGRLEAHRLSQRELMTEQHRVSANIQHMREHEHKPATECPRCKHQWRLGFNQATLDSLLERSGQLGTKLEELEAMERKNREQIHEINQYLQLYLQFLGIARSTPVLHELWKLLQDSNTAFESATRAVSIIHSFSSDMDDWMKLSHVLKELEEAQKTVAQFQALDLKEIQQCQEQMKEQEVELSNYTITERALVVEIRELNAYLKQVDELNALESSLAYNIDLADTLAEDVLAREHHYMVEEAIRNLQSSLTAKEQVLQAAQKARGNIADLEGRLEDAKLQERSLKLLITTLSPTEGLIAEGMTGFVDNYMAQVNKVIASIWSFEFFVLPVTVGESENAELSYRFPMQMGGNHKPLKDIVEGSLSMQQIFDMAFRVVGMTYLGLEHVPLFLDEFGTGFDEHHKNESLRAIRTIIEQMGFEQTFIISHDSNNYGGLSNAELCVVCDKNVIIPADIPRIV